MDWICRNKGKKRKGVSEIYNLFSLELWPKTFIKKKDTIKVLQAEEAAHRLHQLQTELAIKYPSPGSPPLFSLVCLSGGQFIIMKLLGPLYWITTSLLKLNTPKWLKNKNSTSVNISDAFQAMSAPSQRWYNTVGQYNKNY